VEFRIREFRKSDFEQLWKIDQECFPPGISYSRIELAFYMRRPRAWTLVAERLAGGLEGKAEIVGFIVAEPSPRGRGHIITIDVLPQARRSGVGTALLRGAEQRLQAAGCGSVFLETAVDNAQALAFYRRHDYELLKTIPRYYQNNMDAFLMGKRLGS
jgi:ribosomal-protein-alanine N-acetyltransferase